MSCGSSRDALPTIEKNPPFTLENASYTSWVSGIKGGGSGVTVTLQFKELDTTKIKLENVYFKQRITAIEARGKYFKASFKGKNNTMDDFMMQRDSQKEYGNQAPVVTEYHFPFELSENEAVISYHYRKELYYFKLILEEVQEAKYQ